MHLWTHVCIFVYTYAHLYVFIYVRIYICTRSRMHVCTHVRMYVYKYARMYVCMYVRNAKGQARYFLTATTRLYARKSSPSSSFWIIIFSHIWPTTLDKVSFLKITISNLYIIFTKAKVWTTSNRDVDFILYTKNVDRSCHWAFIKRVNIYIYIYMYIHNIHLNINLNVDVHVNSTKKQS